MKRKYPRVSIATTCELFGKGRQAWYGRLGTYQKRQFEISMVLSWVREIREVLPKTGVHKLYEMLKPKFEEFNIKMGRDKLWRLLQYHKLLVPKRRRAGPRTTNSYHNFWKYPNLVEEITPTRPGQIWVSDITYIRLKNDGFAYLSLITDAYSRKIIGHRLNSNLHTQGPLKALKMALEQRKRPDNKLIHHSDRGIQYFSHTYTGLLQHHKISISMTEGGSPTQNAIAERVNGILKTELGLKKEFRNIYEAERAVESAIYRYNFIRPHSSCNNLVPVKAHQMCGTLRKRWYKRKYPEPG